MPTTSCRMRPNSVISVKFVHYGMTSVDWQVMACLQFNVLLCNTLLQWHFWLGNSSGIRPLQNFPEVLLWDTVCVASPMCSNFQKLKY